MCPEPQKDEGQKHRGKDRAQFMGISGKADTGCRIDDSALKQGQLIVLDMGINLGGQRIFVQNVLGVSLKFLERHECFIVVQGPSAGIGGLSGLFLDPMASEDRLDRFRRESQAELFPKIPGKPPVPKPCAFCLPHDQLLKVACRLCR
jgi:hypothetical protein